MGSPASAETPGPSLAEIRAAAARLRGRIVATPTVALSSDRVKARLPAGADCTVKLELFQQAGSFKARGVLLRLDVLDQPARKRGVAAFSAGNHALAVSWGASREGVPAKVIMPRTADPVRVAGCRALGAEVVLKETIHEARAELDRVVAEEGRSAIHPYESAEMILGAATCGLELIEAHPDLEAIVVPVGGGGLAGGLACAVKLVAPGCQVIGVEPFGADSLYRSFAAGRPVAVEKVETIADSLGAPTALPQSFAVARAFVDEIVRIDDDAMLRAMATLYDALKLAAEPACCAATAAVEGPLKQQLAGKRIGLIACGSNIGEEKFAAFLARGRALRREER